MKIWWLILLLIAWIPEISGKSYQFYNKRVFSSNTRVVSSEKNTVFANLEPKIHKNKIRSEDSGRISRVYFTEKSQTFSIFTFNSYDNPKNWSSLYVSRDFGNSIEKIVIKYKNEEIIADEVYVHRNTIIVFNMKFNVFFSSNNGGISFTTCSLINDIIKEVIFHPRYSDYISIITQNGRDLYISKDAGLNWVLHNHNVIKFIWSPISQYYYLTSKSLTDQNSHILYRGDGENEFQYESLLVNVTDLDGSNDLVYATVRDNEKLNFYISQNDGQFKITKFPHYINASEIQVQHSTGNDIFISLKNGTNQRYLYSALLVDLRFVRLAEIEEYPLNDYHICNNVRILENLPGVIIGNIKSVYSNETINPSFISYTHGSHWDHISPPLSSQIKECKWPSCYFSLTHSCSDVYNKGIIDVNNAPHLILAHGKIVNNREILPTNLYVSSDSGLNWRLALAGTHIFTVINHGSVIVAYPEHSDRVYYSYDEGRVWGFSPIGIKDFYSQVSYHDESLSSFTSLVFGYDPSDNTINIVQSNFTDVLEIPCQMYDYVDITPGSRNNDQCFQGKKNTYKKRTHDSLCYNYMEDMHSFDSADCPCTENDFGCNFGNYMIEGKCVPDPDHISENNTSCTFGEIYFKESKTRKFVGDTCIHSNGTETSIGICGLDEESKSILLRSENNFQMMSLIDGIPTELVIFPIQDQLKSDVSSFGVYLKGNSLFLTHRRGIRQISWETSSDAEISQSRKYLSEKNIRSLQIDNLAKNLYFINSSGINILSIEGKYRKIIVSSTKIKLYKIFPKMGFISYVTRFSEGNLDSVTFIDMNGSFIISHNVVGYVQAISEGSWNSIAEIYTLSAIYLIGKNFSVIDWISHRIDDIIEVEMKYGTTYILTKTGIMYNRSLIKYPFFDEMHIYDDRDLGISPCSKSLCKYICTSSIGNTYTCLCPNKMKPVNQFDCECDDQNPECKDCDDDEFMCNNDKCVSLIAKCNGINDCGDNSDEYDCDNHCNGDQYTCSDDSDCIGIEFLCDGVENCPDGSDEKYCDHREECEEQEFTCYNGDCIPIENACDGQDDCGDYSDEQNCKNRRCHYFEFGCIDGGCILNDYVCDGELDCLDGSDEKNCISNNSDSVKPENCTLECDGVCIPKSKVCNGITDCKNKIDELDCGYEVECPNDFERNCPNELLCYSNLSVCDGFSTCSDGSDELGCSNSDLCKHPFNFHCKNTNECILASKYCNGIKDCSDNSDEEDNCFKKQRITTVTATMITSNSVNLTFKSIYKEPEESYHISIIPWKHNKTKNYTTYTHDESFIIYHLAPCSEYIAHVSFYGFDFGFKMDFVTHSKEVDIPRNLMYDKNSSILEWFSNTYSCQPYVYYVQCESNGNITHRNFTKNNKISLTFLDDVNCKVATCGNSVYNLTCSNFSNKITIKKDKGNKSLQIALGIVIPICIIGLGIGIFVLYKYLASAKTQFSTRDYRNLFTNNKWYRFRNERDLFIRGDDKIIL